MQALARALARPGGLAGPPAVTAALFRNVVAAWSLRSTLEACSRRPYSSVASSVAPSDPTLLRNFAIIGERGSAEKSHTIGMLSAAHVLGTAAAAACRQLLAALWGHSTMACLLAAAWCSPRRSREDHVDGPPAVVLRSLAQVRAAAANGWAARQQHVLRACTPQLLMSTLMHPTSLSRFMLAIVIELVVSWLYPRDRVLVVWDWLAGPTLQAAASRQCALPSRAARCAALPPARSPSWLFSSAPTLRSRPPYTLTCAARSE